MQEAHLIDISYEFGHGEDREQRDVNHHRKKEKD